MSLFSDVTLRQLKLYKPQEGQEPTLTSNEGHKYYGDIRSTDRLPHGRGVMLYADGSRYGGEWKDGTQHGKGVMITATFEYEGDWDSDKMHGTGTIHYKHNSGVVGLVVRGIQLLSPFEQVNKPLEYRGEFHKVHHRHGHGQMTYENGDAYEGEWANNRRCGQGTMRYESGEKYVGTWIDDTRSGEGTISYATGAVFTGKLMNDKRCGTGIQILPNGDQYTGEFQDDQINGNGIMIYRNGDRYEGGWKDGVRHGKGTFLLKKRGAIVTGTFYKGLIDGAGSVEFPHSSFFLGEFKHGERKKGTLWTEEGCVYHGEWRGDNYHGQGLMWYGNGDFYYGAWAGNARNGPGNLNLADGSEYSGEFQNDLRHGKGVLQDASGVTIQCGLWGEDILVSGYAGEWDGLKPCGIGKLLMDAGRFYGNFRDGMRVNLGGFWLKDGTLYKGAWKDDLPHGQGYFRCSPPPGRSAAPEGVLYDCYNGEWVEGQRHGHGVVATVDGRIFAGMFIGGTQCGEGVLRDVDNNSPIFTVVEPAPPVAPPESSNAEAPKKKAGVMSWFSKSEKPSEKPTPSVSKVLTGYAFLYTVVGAWSEGKLVGPGTLLFPDGRMFQTSFLNSCCRNVMPHAPQRQLPKSGEEAEAAGTETAPTAPAVPPAAPTTCLMCSQAFGLFRRATTCSLCGRIMCTSCVKETPPHPGAAVVAATGTVPDLAAPKSGSTTPPLTAAPSPNALAACPDCIKCLQLNLIHGSMWDASSTYCGYIAGDQMHGRGTLWDANGTVYDGEFTLGRRNGLGTEYYANEELYTGSWADDRQEGEGTYRSKTGVAYQGVWSSGTLAKLNFYGETNDNNERDGTGISIDGDCEYNGEWLRGKRHGTGSAHYEDGRIYTGQFYEDRVEGVGRLLLADTSVYTGAFKDGMRHGEGMLKQPDGTILIGHWVQDRLHGAVKTYSKDKEMFETLFVDGVERHDALEVREQVPDSAAKQCSCCKSDFGMFLRRHHCRLCGQIFCHACSSKRAVLPKHFITDGTAQRVCVGCFVDLEAGIKIGIRHFPDGSMYAGRWRGEEWYGKGLFRKCNGAVTVSETSGFVRTTSTEAEVKAFIKWWDETMAGLGGDIRINLEERVGELAEVHRTAGAQLLNFTIASFKENAFHPKPQIVIPTRPPPPTSARLPQLPSRPAEPTDEEFLKAVHAVRDVVPQDDRPKGYKLNVATPPKPPPRVTFNTNWATWQTRSLPPCSAIEKNMLAPCCDSTSMTAATSIIDVPPVANVATMRLRSLGVPLKFEVTHTPTALFVKQTERRV